MFAPVVTISIAPHVFVQILVPPWCHLPSARGTLLKITGPPGLWC
jgi:hypothetical protein